MSRKLTGIKKEVTAAQIEKSKAEKSYTKVPVRETVDQNKLRDYISTTQPLYFRVFYALSVETAHRPGDLSALKWSNINLDTGEMSVIVNKQTQAAQSRARKAFFKAEMQRDIETAKRRRDFDEWDKLERMSVDDWVNSLPDERYAPLAAAAENHVDKEAKAKLQENVLPRVLVNALIDYKKSFVIEPLPGDYVFPSYITKSPRAKSASIVNGNSHVSRTTFWRHMRQCIENALLLTATTITQQLKRGGNRVMRLLQMSLYSLRKTSIHFVAAGNGVSYTNMDEAQNFVGHSSQDMTKKYSHAGIVHALNEDVRGEVYSFN